MTPKKNHGEESKHYHATVLQNLTSQQRGRIAEAAVLIRLVLHGYEVYTSVFDGDKVDCLVCVSESGRILKLQVRCVHSLSGHGLPVVRLSCTEGHSKRRRYKEGEFDFIIGYYLFNDTAYVFTFDELVRHKRYVTVSNKYAERWDQLKPHVQCASLRDN